MLMGITFCRSGHVYKLILITKFKSQSKLFDKLSPMANANPNQRLVEEKKENREKKMTIILMSV